MAKNFVWLISFGNLSEKIMALCEMPWVKNKLKFAAKK